MLCLILDAVMYLDAIGNIADVTHDQYHAVVCDQVIFNSWQFVVAYLQLRSLLKPRDSSPAFYF